jgi:hypothetical protein
VHREDVRVPEPGGDPDLLGEPLGAERRTQLGAEHLEGDRAVVPEVVGQIDRRHSASADLTLEAVLVGQGGGEGT